MNESFLQNCANRQDATFRVTEAIWRVMDFLNAE